MAVRITTLAAEFHWTEQFILMELPLARAEQYYHALLRRHGWRTYIPAAKPERQMEALEECWGTAPDLTLPPELEAAFLRFEAKK